MGRLIAIDYGEKKCGIAETDDLKMIASPLTTVPTAEIIDFVQKYLSKYKVEGIVLGEARYLNGDASTTTAIQAKFEEKLKSKFPNTPVHRVNEMFTSAIATRAIQSMDLSKKKREDKGLVDAISASIILRDFLG
jgi:putative Holliday junction resolvase